MNKKVIIGICVIIILVVIVGVFIKADIFKENTSNQNATESYIPENISVNNQNIPDIDNNSKPEEINRKIENVTIEVLQETISRGSVEILITDNNENHYGWGVEFKIQQKVNGEWKELNYVSDNLSWIDIAYGLNENNQLNQKLDIEKYYGKLSNGIYRVVKPVYDNEYIDIYSNEFEIK